MVKGLRGLEVGEKTFTWLGWREIRKDFIEEVTWSWPLKDG